MRQSIYLLGVILIFNLGISGCQRDDITRHRLSGTVTYQGKPVPTGAIFFEPDASQGNSGAPSYAQIKEGKYDTSADGVGFIGGPHVVRIEAFDGQSTNEYAPQGASLTKRKNYIKKFDFPAGDTEQDFEITEVVK